MSTGLDPDASDFAIYEANTCLQDGCTREAVHDDQTNAFVGYPTAGTICRECAIFLFGVDLLAGAPGGEPIEQRESHRELWCWGYDLLFGSVPQDIRDENHTLSWPEVRALTAALPILRLRQPPVVFTATFSPCGQHDPDSSARAECRACQRDDAREERHWFNYFGGSAGIKRRAAEERFRKDEQKGRS